MFILFVSTSTFAQDTISPLTAHAKISPYQFRPEETVELKIQLSLPSGYKAYEDQFRIQIVKPEGFKLSSFQVSPVEEFYDKFSKKNRKGMSGDAQLIAPIEAPKEINESHQELEIEITYQACTDTFCLFPKTITLKAPFQFVSDTKNQTANTSFLNTEFKSMFEKGLWWTFIFVFLAGVLTSFTPCIFPMIPITLAVLGKHAHTRSRSKNFIVSNLYVLGIAVTYSIMGVIAASTGAMFGSFMSHPLVLLAMCVVFLAMALSMFGLYEIQPPQFIQKRFSNTSDLTGYSGAFISGIFSGVVASPCVGPVLVGILTYIAKTQNLWLGFFLMFTYAMGMGQIFLVLGAFSQLTKLLPKSGPWLDGVKYLFGILMLGVFYYFLSLLIPQKYWDVSLGLGLILAALYFGVFSKAAATSPYIKKILMHIFILTGVGFILLGFFDFRSLLQERWITDKPGYDIKALNWKTFSEAELESAKKAGKPVIIDFWADWCAACKELEQFTFTNQRFQLLSTNFVLLKFDATKESPELDALRKKYEIVGLPTILFFDKNGVWRPDLTLTAFEEADKFIERMMKLKPF